MPITLNTKPIHLRIDEFNDYIEECKEKCIIDQGEITPKEKNLLYRCGVDYGLTINKKVGVAAFEQLKLDHNLILRIKGPFTLPLQAQFTSERGAVNIRPYIIHESAASQRLHSIANDLHEKELISSVVPIDAEYIYEALRETAFNIAMEEAISLGNGFQIIQIEFDENGHFKAVELDESDY